ncbi:uncharacterized protein M6B38_267550 [Iris pallida]|uniref:Uncharacterized protein n=1 Tax=Iris pallida TaxID=29817 RepID=A0AAX6FC20_IRIPA|nr:uncharacterized protein M6B38_141415 [Iris pallida]KAJ6849550.1 uncharacterized protein M6B38_267550 [Iris pallida]
MGRSEPNLAPEWLAKYGPASNASSDAYGSGFSSRNRLSLLEEPHNHRADSGSVKPLNYSNFRRKGDRRRNADVSDCHRALSVDVGSPAGHHGSVLGARTELDSPWSSRSAGSGRRGELWGKSLEDDLDDFVLPKRSLFRREFPSLGAKEKHKLLSPVHIAPISSGLNMAKTVAQAPLLARNAPQLSVEAHRTDKLTLRQSKQLIPLTPKTCGLNSLEKPKSKGARAGQELSSQLVIVNNALRAVTARSDVPKASQVGNLQVLNRDRNSTISSSVVKDVSDSDVCLKSPTNQYLKAECKDTGSNSMSSSKRTLNSLQAKGRNAFFNSIRNKASVNPSTGIVPYPGGCLIDASEKSLSLDEKITEKCAGASMINQEGDANGSGGVEKVGNDDATSGEEAQNEKRLQSESNVDDKQNSSQQSCFPVGNYDPVVDVDGEEAAFLRLLGWDEHAEVEAIKDEEIAAFKKQYEKKLRLLSKLSLLG